MVSDGKLVWTTDILAARFFVSKFEAERTVKDILSKTIAAGNVGEHGEVFKLLQLRLNVENLAIARP